MTVQWPNRRQELLDGLALLAGTPPPLSDAGWDQRQYNLTEAVHAVVDDTGWDEDNPSEWIGLVLVDEAEAAAVRPVVRAVVAVSERQGAAATDRNWYGDPLWPQVQQLAADAFRLLNGERG